MKIQKKGVHEGSRENIKFLCKFDGKMREGIYYVETEDTNLFHKSNIYSACIVVYGLKQQRIKLDDIKQYLNPVNKQPRNRFVKLFEKYRAICPEQRKVGKYCCNLMTGLLGRKTKKKIN